MRRTLVLSIFLSVISALVSALVVTAWAVHDLELRITALESQRSHEGRFVEVEQQGTPLKPLGEWEPFYDAYEAHNKKGKVR